MNFFKRLHCLLFGHEGPINGDVRHLPLSNLFQADSNCGRCNVRFIIQESHGALGKIYQGQSATALQNKIIDFYKNTWKPGDRHFEEGRGFFGLNAWLDNGPLTPSIPSPKKRRKKK